MKYARSYEKCVKDYDTIFAAATVVSPANLMKAKELWRRHQTLNPELFALLSRLKTRYRPAAAKRPLPLIGAPSVE